MPGSWWQTCLSDLSGEGQEVRYEQQHTSYSNLLPHGATDTQEGLKGRRGMQVVQSVAATAPMPLDTLPASPSRATAREASSTPIARYREWESIRAALDKGDTVLVRGSWVEQVYYSGASLPKRQDLPDEAIFSVEDLMRDVKDYRRPTPQILALSHCWLSDEDPDPEMLNLYTFAPLLRHFAQSCRVTTESVAIFYDWCSLKQEPRTEEEQESWTRAMQDVELWYTHWKSQVWLLTSVPEGITSYKERGWCFFERSLATMGLPSESVLDLGALRANWTHWSQVIRECQAPRHPPLAPHQFDDELYKRSFKNEDDDRQLCVRKYEEVFQEVMGTITELYYGGLGWTDIQAEQLATVLPLCNELREVDLRGNVIADAGAYALADAVSQCPKLQVIDLEGNIVDTDGLVTIRESWHVAGKNSHYLKLGEQQTKPTTSASRKAAAFRAVNGDRQSEEISEAQLASLVARQAAFEARIMSAVSKMQGGLSDVATNAGLVTREGGDEVVEDKPTPFPTHLRL